MFASTAQPIIREYRVSKIILYVFVQHLFGHVHQFETSNKIGRDPLLALGRGEGTTFLPCGTMASVQVKPEDHMDTNTGNVPMGSSLEPGPNLDNSACQALGNLGLLTGQRDVFSDLYDREPGRDQLAGR